MQIKYLILIFTLRFAGVCAAQSTTPANSQDRFSEESISYDFALGLLKRGLDKEAATEFSKFLQRFPTSKKAADAILNRAQAYFNSQQFALAGKDYYTYLQTNPTTDPELRLRYGICLYELKQYKDALNTLAPLQKDKNKIGQSAMYYRGLALQKTGQNRQAKDTLLQVSDNQLKPTALYTAAQIALDEKEYKDSSTIITQLIEEFPTHHLSEKARLIRANALRLKGDLSESAADFAKLIHSSDNELSLNASYGLAWTYYGNNQLEKATQLLQSQLINSKRFSHGSHYLLGLISFKNGKYQQAIEYLQKVQGTEFTGKAMLSIAWSYYKLGKYPTAISTISDCRKQYPDFMPQELFYLTGRCYWQMKEYQKSATEFASAAALTGARSKEAGYELAAAYQKSAQYQKAAEAYSDFITKYPEDKLITSANTGLADSLIKLGRYEAAVPVYLKLLKNTGSKLNPQYLQHLGVCYYHLKQYKNMALSYEAILKHYPKNPAAANALFWLGWYNSNAANFEKAVNYYNQLLSAHPKSKLIPAAQYDLALTHLRAKNKNKAAELFYQISQSQPGRLKEQEQLWLAQFYFNQNDYAKAIKIYQTILNAKPQTLTRSIALRGLGKTYQKQQQWTSAADAYQQALQSISQISEKSDVTRALQNEALFGLATSQRELKQFTQAQATLEKINVTPDDPFAAKIYFEQGLLAFSGQNYKLAIDRLMHVGLLIDDQELAGLALLRAAQACEIIKDFKKAKICYQELAGRFKGSYGQTYPQSKYTFIGKQKLKTLQADNQTKITNHKKRKQ